MRKLTMIALFLCGLTLTFNAQTSPESVPTTLSIDASSSQSTALTVSGTTESSVSEAAASSSKPKKKFKERSLAGKILIIAGLVIFGSICLMFGTVTIG